MVVPSPSSPAPAKGALRTAMRAARRDFARSLDPATRAAMEAALAGHLRPALLASTCVAGYQPMIDEVSPLDALAFAAAAGRTVAFPTFADRDSRISFHAGQPTEPGPWGLLQPPLDAPMVAPDLVLVPLLAIDAGGNRIGQGKGHYDRVLPRLREAGARLIGVGWAMQLVDRAIAPDRWDVRLDGFASPDGLIEFSA